MDGLMACALLFGSILASPEGEPVDKERASPTFRIVTAPGARRAEPVSAISVVAKRREAFQMANAVSLGGRWGRVTSTFRTPEHNRRVGGMRNSYHLRNRAIDIARHRGVTHRQIDEAYRRAGYVLIESLDEGDHSHFAFADPVGATAARRLPETRSNNGVNDVFRIVVPPSAR